MVDTTAPFEIIESLDPPVLTIVVSSEYHMRLHQRELIQALIDRLSSASTPIWTLLDIREVRVEWSDLVAGLAEAKDAAISTQNPNNLGTLVVTDNDILKLGMKALGQRQYGGSRVALFESIDDALAFARSQPGL